MSNMNSICDHVYIINLKSRPDRKFLIEKKFRNLNIQYEIVEAIDGASRETTKILDEIFSTRGFSACDDTTILQYSGELGLILTWKNILKDAIDKQYSSIAIFEDDACFHKNIEKMISDNMEIFNSNRCDVIYLGASQHPFTEKQLHQMSSQNYFVVDRDAATHGTYSILLSKIAIMKIYNSLRIINRQIYSLDNHLWHLIVGENMNAIVMYPFLIFPDVSDSNIRGYREIAEYCKIRRYDADCYDYIGIDGLHDLVSLMERNKIKVVDIIQRCHGSNSYRFVIDTFAALGIPDNLSKNIVKFCTKGDAVNMDDVYYIINGFSKGMREVPRNIIF